MSNAESEDMDMEESIPPDPHAGLRKQLEELVKDSQVFCHLSVILIYYDSVILKMLIFEVIRLAFWSMVVLIRGFTRVSCIISLLFVASMEAKP